MQDLPENDLREFYVAYDAAYDPVSQALLACALASAGSFPTANASGLRWPHVQLR